MFRLSKLSLSRLETVDERLQSIVKCAIGITEVDFMVVQGLRTFDEQARLYGKGRTRAQMAARQLPMEYARPNDRKVTWTMNSNHMSGRAVDLGAWVNGRLYMPDRPTDADIELYRQISTAMKAAACAQNVRITWGGDWTTTKDYPHYEIPA